MRIVSVRPGQLTIGIAVALTLLTATVPMAGAQPDVAGVGTPTAREGLRAQLGPIQARLRQDHAKAFGGLWIDGAGVPVVAVIGEDSGVKNAVLGSSLAVSPRFVSVDSSEIDLETLHSQIVSATVEGFRLGAVELAAVETDIINNRVNVVAVGATEEQLTQIRARFGHEVATSSVAERSVGLACNNTNCPNPLKAGLKLYRPGSPTFACMSGFVYRWNSSYYLSTAGHCSTLGDTYQHPSGTTRGSVSHQGWVSNSPADVSLFPIASSQKSNQICAATNGTCVITSVTQRENPALGQEVIGESVCGARQTTATCGTLVSVNTTICVSQFSGGPCNNMTYLRRATFAVAPGDSGGAVYAFGWAMGHISTAYPGTTNAMYSHVINVEGYFQMVVQLTP